MVRREFIEKANKQGKKEGFKVQNVDYDLFLENLVCDFVTEIVGVFSECEVTVKDEVFIISLTGKRIDDVYIRR